MSTDKAVLDEITRRVFELEGEQRHFERHGEEINDHIEALAEVSRLPRQKIEAIAYALTHDDSLRPTRGREFWQPLAVTLAVVSVVGVLFFINPPITPQMPAQPPAVEPPLPQAAAPAPAAPAPQAIAPQPVAILNPADQAMQRLYVQRAALANALSRVSALKTYVVNYYLENGKHPENFAQLGMPDEEIGDGEYIEQVKILPEGALRVELTEFFGAGAYFILKQQEIMGGTQIKWQCASNLAQEILAIGYAGSSVCAQDTP